MIGSQPYSFGFHIKVWRGTLEDDGYGHGGDPEEDFEVSWVAPTVVSEQFLRPIAMDTALEAPSSGAPLAIEEALTVYLAYGTDITNRDRLEVLDGPYRGMYEVDGTPAHWLNPYTGLQAGTAVKLGKKAGG